MIFKDLIDKYTWDDIKDKFLILYPDQAFDFPNYKKMFNSLKIMKPVNHDMEIIVRYFDKDDLIINDEDFEPYYSVGGKDSNEETWAIEFVPWNEWLGMRVNPTIDEIDFIIHCLWEMSFIGFDENYIQKKLSYINDSASEGMKEIRRIEIMDSIKRFLNKIKKLFFKCK